MSTRATPGSRRADAAAHGIRLEVVKHTEAKRGFVLLPRRWVVERSFAWVHALPPPGARLRALAHTLAGLHFLAFACLFLHRAVPLLTRVPFWQGA